MAKRQDDGTVSLQQANAFAKACDSADKVQQNSVVKTAKKALDAAFRSPLSLARDGQKPLRG